MTNLNSTDGLNSTDDLGLFPLSYFENQTTLKPRTLKKYALDGRLKAVKHNNTYYTTQLDFNRFLNQREQAKLSKSKSQKGQVTQELIDEVTKVMHNNGQLTAKDVHEFFRLKRINL